VAETAELPAQRRADASDAQRLYAQLVDQHYDSVHNYLCWLARDNALAADLTDEAFVQLWRYLPRPRRGGSLRAYVFKIALNLYKRHLRHDGVELLPLEEAERAPADAWYEPPLALERDELCRHVRLAVERLPDTCRAVVLLHNLEGFTLREVAEVLEVPLGTAKSRLAAGFAMLRRLLHEWKEDSGELQRVP
jgi:RNA polymerase sigma-70 factor (ECF subfamily)